jgi:hypothetical protein
MLLNIPDTVDRLNQTLTVDPMAAIRFVQAELSSQIATSLSSRTSRLGDRLANLERAYQLDETMRALAPGDAIELPSFALFDPLTSASVVQLDEFVDQQGLFLAPTRIASDALAMEMIELGFDPPPVMVAVLSSVTVEVTSKEGELISSSIKQSLTWMTEDQRAGIPGTKGDMGNNVASFAAIVRAGTSDENTKTTTIFYCLDRKANRRFTAEQLSAVRAQVAQTQVEVLPELQLSSAVISAQTILLNGLIRDQQRVRVQLVNDEKGRQEGRQEYDTSRKSARERTSEERLVEDRQAMATEATSRR